MEKAKSLRHVCSWLELYYFGKRTFGPLFGAYSAYLGADIQ